MKTVICTNCLRNFRVWDTSSKKISCPFCGVKGKNPYYIQKKEIQSEKVFVRVNA